jgi:hypothetical protein
MSIHDDDTDPGLTRTTTQRLVSIVQLAVDDVEIALGGPLLERRIDTMRERRRRDRERRALGEGD